ncbi:hypothetical protein KPL71_004197 [Citrus sinensis]|uniref:Uncharacterized protein n=1 Tax=Citrus sinensis TaxID=2711 RepID=A0ACB8N4U8_CITSI|nr:hypothetical protein KPL71_004197 [Citrus sinensis]
MFSSCSQSYQESFPPLERHTDPQTKVVSQPYVQSPITTSGAPEAPKQYEAVLNWQTQNAIAQNQALHHLGKKIDKNIISELDIDLRTMINNRIWGLEFNKKEAEIRQLKAELARIDANKAQPSLLTKTQSIPIPAPLFTSYQPFYNPAKQSTTKNYFTKKIQIKNPSYQSHYQQIHTHNNDSDSTSEESLPSTDNFSSSTQTSSDSKSQYADISGLLMATKTEDPSTSTPVVDTPIVDESSDDNNDEIEPVPLVPPVSEKSSKPSSSPWFTFDDIPLHKWQAQHQEFSTWIDVQMTSPNAQSYNVLREFCSRFIGSL